MTPAGGPPTLITINGIGLSIYGERDRDRDTNTYVKTHAFVVLFVPIFFVAAYRVADAPRGWYFIGRVPLSGFARTWNKLVLAGLLTLVALGVWGSYTGSPAYQAQRTLEQARAAEADGRADEALRLYCSLTRTPSAAEGRAGALRALQAAELPRLAVTLRQVVGAYRQAVDPAMKDVLARRAMDGRATDPRAALELGRALGELDKVAFEAMREPLLEALVATGDEVEARSELAALYEARGELDRAVALLTPVADRLGTTDGARLLGQALARQGDLEGSNRLLMPWLEARLGDLHAAEAAFEQGLEAAQQTALGQLRSGAAPQSWYARYDAAGDDEKEAMVFRWIQEKVRADARVTRAREKLDGLGAVVPVALDLGLVKLQRAQGLEGQARREELEAAERVFLAVRGVAEDSPTYKLGLAQVYYWLGREPEGHALLEALLAADRSARTLLTVATTLREVGARSECQALVEEAYAAGGEEEKREAASFRAIISEDTDDRIAWLEKAGSSDPAVLANLEYSRGLRALEHGDRAEAGRRLRASADQYRAMAENPTTLNNGALALHLLFSVTGKRADFDAYVDLLSRAERLSRDDSIIIGNLAFALFGRAALRVVEPRLDLAALHVTPDLSLLDWTYVDRAGYEATRDALLAEPDLKAALERLSTLRTLAPKQVDGYRGSLAGLRYARALDAHQALLRAAQAAELDLGDALAEAQELVAPAEEEQVLRARKRADERDALLRDLPASAGAATRAVATCWAALTRLALHELGDPVDLDALLALAEAGHAAHASHGSREAVTAILLTRAADRAARSAPAFAAMRRRVGRGLAAAMVVRAALTGPDEALRASLAADPDVVRAAGLMADELGPWPDSAGGSDWALAQAVDPALGAAIARAMGADEVGRVRDEVWRLLEPVDASTILSSAWRRQAQGDVEGARATLAAAAQRGVPLPYGD